jgi:hypothetical protein
LAGIVEELEGPAGAVDFRIEAEDIHYRIWQEEDSSGNLINALAATRIRLRGALLGASPWGRAFALETIPKDLAASNAPLFEALLGKFRTWASTAGPEAVSYWVEACIADLARCRFAVDDFDATLLLVSEALIGLRRFAEQDLVLGRLNLSGALLLFARESAQNGDADGANAAYAEAFDLSRPSSYDSHPNDLRRHAAVAWFYAQFLGVQNRSAEVSPIVESGFKAATAFARFGMQDGAAILAAYRP